MKLKVIRILIFLIIVIHSTAYSYFTKQQVQFSPNNTSTWIWNTGVFNQDMRTTNTPGFQWPQGSNKFAIFTSGLNLGAYVNGRLRLATASYAGEYRPGYVIDSAGIPLFKTDERFKLYSVRYNSTPLNNPDVIKWKDMVPFGAPFEDRNNNNTYEYEIDKPGMPGAVQTIFVCLTDADSNTHSASEGFAGGTRPLYAEIHLTAWGYDLEPINNVQFLRWDIINKNNSSWDKFHSCLMSDPDLGDGTDDYIGSDTLLQMIYCYNAKNIDGTGAQGHYGLAPPAVGQILLRSTVSNNKNFIDTMKVTSSTYYVNGGPISCETDPTGSPLESYNYMKGFKNDGTPWVNPLSSPYSPTKFCYTGNPEDSTGWTEKKGRIENCNGALTGNLVVPVPMGGRRTLLSSGSDFLTVNPGDTQTIVVAQMIARGSSNVNSVTKLKELAAHTRKIYYQAIENTESIYIEPPPPLPIHYSLKQNYPNPFNPVTTIRYEMKKLWRVKIQIYDARGELISTLVNEEKPQGAYEIKFDGANLPSGIYFIKMVSGGGFEDSKKMVLLK